LIQVSSGAALSRANVSHIRPRARCGRQLVAVEQHLAEARPAPDADPSGGEPASARQAEIVPDEPLTP